MGIKVESKLVHVLVEAVSEQSNLLKENGKLNHGSGITKPIKFGSHGTKEPKKGEVSRILASNVPKDIVEDWPEPKQIHSFYSVKFRRFEDPKLKAKIELAEKELQKKNQLRSQIIEKLKAKRVSFFGESSFGCYVAQTIRKCQGVPVGFSKNSVFSENPTRVPHQRFKILMKILRRNGVQNLVSCK